MSSITFTYANLDVEFPNENVSRASFDLILAGDTYRVNAEHNSDDSHWDLEVTYEGVDQYYEYDETVDFGYGGPDHGYVRGGYVDKDTYISRNIPLDWLEDWILDEIWFPIQEEIRKATTAVIARMNGSSGTVTWDEA